MDGTLVWVLCVVLLYGNLYGTLVWMVLSYGTLVWYVTVWYVFLNNFNIISEHVKNESLKNFPRNENFIKENEKLRRKTKHLKVTNVNDLKRAYVLMARLANTPTVCSLTQ